MGKLFPNGPVVALTLLSLALAGCGSVRAGDGSPGGPASATAHSGPPSPASTASQSPQARAQADAAAILAAFVPPPGATRLSSAPGGVGGRLTGSSPGPDVVEYASWWQVPGMTPLQMLAWEKAHLPHQFRLAGFGGEEMKPPKLPNGLTFPADPYHAADYAFGLPPVTGILTSRELDVEAARSTSGQTYVRVDSQVNWQPVRPASTFIPSGVRAVTVTAVAGMNDRTKPPAPVTMTDAARVRKLVALVNAQPLFPPGVFNCPFDDGRGVRLTFLAGPGRPTVATAFAKSNGCGGVDLTIGKRQVSLAWGSTAAEQALAISGMNWKLFGYLPT